MDVIDHDAHQLIDKAAELEFDALALTLHDHDLRDPISLRMKQPAEWLPNGKANGSANREAMRFPATTAAAADPRSGRALIQRSPHTVRAQKIPLVAARTLPRPGTGAVAPGWTAP